MARSAYFRMGGFGSIRIALILSMLWLTLGAAHAHDGLAVGLTTSMSPDTNATANLLVSYPVMQFQTHPDTVYLAARADIGYSLTHPGFPSVGVAAVASSIVASDLSDAETYFGAGMGFAFAPSPLAVPYMFGGGRIGVAGALHAIWEIHVAIASGTVAPSFGMGIEYNFGGSR